VVRWPAAIPESRLRAQEWPDVNQLELVMELLDYDSTVINRTLQKIVHNMEEVLL
jgi:hypothetical protein